MTRYEVGFMSKCAEYGLAADEAVGLMKIAQFKMDSMPFDKMVAAYEKMTPEQLNKAYMSLPSNLSDLQRIVDKVPGFGGSAAQSQIGPRGFGSNQANKILEGFQRRRQAIEAARGGIAGRAAGQKMIDNAFANMHQRAAQSAAQAAAGAAPGAARAASGAAAGAARAAGSTVAGSAGASAAKGIARGASRGSNMFLRALSAMSPRAKLMAGALAGGATALGAGYMMRRDRR